MDSVLRSALEPRVERLGYLGDFFQCAANVPDALVHFVRFTESAKGPLDDRIVELVAITVAALTQNAYELHQHERLAIRLGLGHEWVQDVERLEPACLADAGEQAVQRYLLAAIPTYGRAATEDLQAIVDELGPEDAVAVMLLAGRYVAHALAVNSLDLAAPVPSIFEDGFDGT
jgi:alkylhydroperoxidase family enzyme